MVKVCSNCGTKNFDDAIVCMNCGTKFEDGGFVTDEAITHDHISEYENVQTQNIDDSASPKKSNTMVIVAIGVSVVVVVAAIGGILFFTGISNLIGSGVGSLANLDYINYDYGFGLNYPDGWTIDESGLLGNVVQFIGPTTEGGTPSIGITQPTDLPSGQNLTYCVQLAVEMYNQIFTNFSLESGNSLTINNMDTYQIVYTFGNGSLSVKQKQVYILKNEKIYISTYSATPSTYDTFLPKFEESIESLVIV